MNNVALARKLGHEIKSWRKGRRPVHWQCSCGAFGEAWSFAPADAHARWVISGEEPPRERQPISTKMLVKIWKRDKSRCRYCGVQVRKGHAHIDHVIPWSEGGSDTMDNLVLSCIECNLKKGTQHWEPRKISS